MLSCFSLAALRWPSTFDIDVRVSNAFSFALVLQVVLACADGQHRTLSDSTLRFRAKPCLRRSLPGRVQWNNYIRNSHGDKVAMCNVTCGRMYLCAAVSGTSCARPRCNIGEKTSMASIGPRLRLGSPTDHRSRTTAVKHKDWLLILSQNRTDRSQRLVKNDGCASMCTALLRREEYCESMRSEGMLVMPKWCEG